MTFRFLVLKECTLVGLSLNLKNEIGSSVVMTMNYCELVYETVSLMFIVYTTFHFKSGITWKERKRMYTLNILNQPVHLHILISPHFLLKTVVVINQYQFIDSPGFIDCLYE